MQCQISSLIERNPLQIAYLPFSLSSFLSLRAHKCTVEINDAKGKKHGVQPRSGKFECEFELRRVLPWIWEGNLHTERKGTDESSWLLLLGTCYTLGTISSISVTAITVFKRFSICIEALSFLESRHSR